MRKLLCLFFPLIMLLTAAACSPGQGEADGRLAVSASIYPVYDFAVNIGGERASVSLVMPMGVEPHDWEPTPRDIAGLRRADVFLYNGAGMEHWIEAALRSLEGKGPLLIDTSAHAALLEAEEGEHEEEDEDDHVHGAVDPHVWLSVSNAKVQTQAIADAMAEADPANADYYLKNMRLYHEELDRLDAEYRERLSAVSGDTIVTAHKAYGYLCREYGLKQVSVRGFSPEQEPDPAAMARVIDFCRENHVKVIFFESEADPATANAIAAETGAAVRVLTPIESLSQADIERAETYLSLMRRNLDELSWALA